MESSTLDPRIENNSRLKSSKVDQLSEENIRIKDNLKKNAAVLMKNEKKFGDDDQTENQEKILFGNFSKLLEANINKANNVNIDGGSQASRSSGSQTKRIQLLQHIIQKREPNKELRMMRKFFFLYFICLVCFASVTFAVNWSVLSNLQNSRDLINLSDHRLSKLVALQRSVLEIKNIVEGYVEVEFLQSLGNLNRGLNKINSDNDLLW
jgi:hypothetical protein